MPETPPIHIQLDDARPQWPAEARCDAVFAGTAVGRARSRPASPSSTRPPLR